MVAWKNASFSSAIRHCSKFSPLIGLSVQYPRSVRSSKTINSDGLVAEAMILNGKFVEIVLFLQLRVDV